MDASMYKDYVLVLLFIKYVSDKYAGQPYGQIQVPEGASFADMVQLKGKKDIGDKINKQVIGPLFAANKIPRNQAADFNDESKLGRGEDMVDTLTKLVAIFENPALDFSGNRAAHDDILGDAYEFLMRHFALDSGKSKGQFYTPAEVSRVVAKVLDLRPEELGPHATAFDPACGSGSLLLKVAEEADRHISIYGQEKDVATSTLARMNVVLHDMPGALHEIESGNTLASPRHLNEGQLKQFDYVVANPPFSYKSWTNGVAIGDKDKYHRFEGFGVPPNKNGDYAWVLHILKCLKSRGRAAVILPHGVLFRGNAEAGIREQLVRRGLLKAVIGLPANLFYGTGIPACILLLDKADAAARRDIFLVDASRGYLKDGNKNRLRERDIHRIVDVVTAGREVAGFSRCVPHTEIADNEYNLNLPRYIDGREKPDVQDIDGHLNGGIPARDVDGLQDYWTVLPTLRKHLFARDADRQQYYRLRVGTSALRETILQHPEFTAHQQHMQDVFGGWRERWCKVLEELKPAGFDPKVLIKAMAEDLLARYSGQPLTDPYAVYQQLLDYWNETLQDDLYLISTDGWDPGRGVYRLLKTTKNKGKTKTSEVKGIAGMESKLLPPQYLIARFFDEEQAELDRLAEEIEVAQAAQNELAEEHGGDEGVFGELDSITKTSVTALYKQSKGDPELTEERAVMKQFLKAAAEEATAKKQRKQLEATLEAELWDTYGQLTDEEIITLVVEDKWLAHLATAISTEQDRSSQQLAVRVSELADRYATPLRDLSAAADALECRVQDHLTQMGFAW